ncbi:unnamed protein product [Lupinus luteus]|uniref:Uncharacterized protein n=1 Tax=Lupinus luteus TaxID=3873 RepID=A0AAV1X7J7_LUPLU
MFGMQINWKLKETHLMDHIQINLAISLIMLNLGFHTNENTKVLKYGGYDYNIRKLIGFPTK